LPPNKLLAKLQSTIQLQPIYTELIVSVICGQLDLINQIL